MTIETSCLRYGTQVSGSAALGQEYDIGPDPNPFVVGIRRLHAPTDLIRTEIA
jgi:hypothetical protein